MTARAKLPLVLLTGFLGSGKTTLLRQLLDLPEWRDTAVLVNELGSVALDHHQLWATGAEVALVENGCICCSVNEDMVGVLEELFWKRLRRDIPQFRRVVIETTGLADPRPILGALRSHPLVADRYQLQTIACTVDAEHGLKQLHAHDESHAQARCADMLLITKCDRAAGSAVRELKNELAALNPLAEQFAVFDGKLTDGVPLLLSAPGTQARDRHFGQFAHTASLRRPLNSRGGSAVFHSRVYTQATRTKRSWDAGQLRNELDDMVGHCGEHMFRMKGLFRLQDGSQVVANAVYGTMFPLEELPVTVEGDSFVVCIGAASIESAVRRALDRIGVA